MKIEVAIIEDDPNYRQMLQLLINNTPEMSCQYVFASGKRAVESILSLNKAQLPDVLIVDLNLPDMSGVECIRELKPGLPTIQYLVLTVSEENDNIFEALRSGANGYLLKKSALADIIHSIKGVCDGNAPMSPLIAKKLVAYFQKPNSQDKSPYDDLLTRREKEVLRLLSRGLLYKQIAGELHISDETVKSHCHHIYEKLHVTTRMEAVNKFYGRAW